MLNSEKFMLIAHINFLIEVVSAPPVLTPGSLERGHKCTNRLDKIYIDICTNLKRLKNLESIEEY